MLRAASVRRCRLAKTDFTAIGDGDDWPRWIRRFEVRSVLEGHPADAFQEALELGCGRGDYSKYLAEYCVHLTATEYDATKLSPRNEGKITFDLADAQDLSRFPDAHFDLIYSSNVIEHLPHVDRCLAECRRTLKDDGILVHSVPNRTWKVFKLLLFYPSLAKMVWRRIGRRRRPAAGTSGGAIEAQPRRRSGFSLASLVPAIHGSSKSHWEEFRTWGEKHWLRTFRRNQLEVVEIVRLPFYFGYGYDFPRLIRIGNLLGLSGCTGYKLKKKLSTTI